MDSALIDAKDFAELNRQLMEEDERREMLIKRSREVLKLSKNSIYAIHRGEITKARDMAREAKDIAKRDLLPIIEKFPSLRYGAFSGSMEVGLGDLVHLFSCAVTMCFPCERV
jgi:predicted translin family RNA/ssDNA-binding protein